MLSTNDSWWSPDRSPIHRYRHIPEFFADRHIAEQIQVEFFPPYASEVNPLEELWRNMKHVEMRNLVTHDMEEIHTEFHLALGRVRQNPRLIDSFFGYARLTRRATKS
jgi:transposase